MSKDAGFQYQVKPGHETESGFHYYDASSTIPGPGGRTRGGSQRTSSSVADAAIGLSGVVVKVAAGAGDRCLAPAQSRPKRRQVLDSSAEDSDSLDVSAVQWTGTGVSVTQLARDYHAQCPLLAKVTQDCHHFARSQVSMLLNIH